MLYSVKVLAKRKTYRLQSLPEAETQLSDKHLLGNSELVYLNLCNNYECNNTKKYKSFIKSSSKILEI